MPFVRRDGSVLVCVCVCVCVCSKYHMYISSELLALLYIYIHDAIDRFS